MKVQTPGKLLYIYILMKNEVARNLYQNVSVRKMAKFVILPFSNSTGIM